MKRNPWIIGHRGASGYAPENTLAAFRRAAELGARFMETDLRLSRDARLVALHDATLERTTNGRGRVRDFTLAELQQLDAGRWFGAEFAGERIPALEDILGVVRRDDLVFYLQVKEEPAEGAEAALVSALRNTQEAASVVVLSVYPKSLTKLRSLEHTLMTGLVLKHLDGAPEEIVRSVLEVGGRQMVARHNVVSAALVEAAHVEGLPVVAWTVNESDRMREMMALGVDGIMTDFPDRLVAVLQETA